MLTRLLGLISARRTRSSNPIQRADTDRSDGPPVDRSHAQPLRAEDLALAMDGQTTADTVIAAAHARAETREKANGWRRLPALWRAAPTPAGTIELTSSVLRYQYPESSGFFVLQHMRAAEARQGSLELLMADTRFTIPRVCRPSMMANMINAILNGTYDPTAPFRPACNSCRHRRPGAGCGANPPGVELTECCPDRQHQDWCPAYRSGRPAPA